MLFCLYSLIQIIKHWWHSFQIPYNYVFIRFYYNSICVQRDHVTITLISSQMSPVNKWFESKCVLCVTDRGCIHLADDLVAEREKSKLLQEEMEATLHDIQNMWTPRPSVRLTHQSLSTTSIDIIPSLSHSQMTDVVQYRHFVKNGACLREWSILKMHFSIYSII